MKKLLLLILASVSFTTSQAAKKTDSQGGYERSIEAVVRNKYFYKTNKLELGITGGVMPYDSLVNHYMGGARLDWHLSDHYGWEVIDAQFAFPSLTGFVTDLAREKGLSNVQTSQLKYLVTTNLLLSPLYGKIRFFGSQVLYFDIYLVVGGGVANTKTVKLSSSASGTAATETEVRSGMEPLVDFGLGIKVFMNDSLGLIFDFRDYLTFTEVYGSKKPRSNFSVFAGLSFFLPNF